MPSSWYLQIGDEERGPYSPDQIRALAHEQVLLPHSLIRKEGMDSWVSADAVGGIFAEQSTPQATQAKPTAPSPDHRRPATSPGAPRPVSIDTRRRRASSAPTPDQTPSPTILSWQEEVGWHQDEPLLDPSQWADRSHRLYAALLDLGTWLIVALPTILTLLIAKVGGASASDSERLASIGFSLTLFLALIAGIWHLAWIFTYAQSIGKRIMGIQIRRTDGRPCSGWRIILLRRMLVNSIGSIPILGQAFLLVDVLLIFRDSQRCLHDDLADTRVVDIRRDRKPTHAHQ